MLLSVHIYLMNHSSLPLSSNQANSQQPKIYSLQQFWLGCSPGCSPCHPVIIKLWPRSQLILSKYAHFVLWVFQRISGVKQNRKLQEQKLFGGEWYWSFLITLPMFALYIWTCHIQGILVSWVTDLKDVVKEENRHTDAPGALPDPYSMVQMECVCVALRFLLVLWAETALGCLS